MTVFQQTNTADSCTADPFCSGNSLDSGVVTLEASEGGTGSATPSALQLDASASALIGIIFYCVDGTNNLEDLDGASGNWVFELNITVANMFCSWEEVQACRILGTGACSNQQVILTGTGLGISLGTTGVKSSGNINQSGTITMGADDEVACLYAFDNSNACAQSFNFNKATGVEITNQWAVPAGDITVDVSDPQGITLFPAAPVQSISALVDVSDPEAILLQPQDPVVEAVVATSIDVSDPAALVIQTQDPTVQTGAAAIVADPESILVQPQAPTAQTGAAAFVADSQPILLQPHGPVVAIAASVNVSGTADLLLALPGPTVQTGAGVFADAGQIILQIQDPTVQTGASVFSDTLSIILNLLDPTIVLAGPTANVSDPVSILLASLDPTIQTGTSIQVDLANLFLTTLDPVVASGVTIQGDTADITLVPLGPTLQAGASVFADAGQIILTPIAPITQTGASIFADATSLLLQPQAPTVQTGASAFVGDATTLVLTVAGPEIIIEGGEITVEVSDRVCLSLVPGAPDVVTGEVLAGRRYSVYNRSSVGHRSVRDPEYTVGSGEVSDDSEN